MPTATARRSPTTRFRSACWIRWPRSFSPIFPSRTCRAMRSPTTTTSAETSSPATAAISSMPAWTINFNDNNHLGVRYSRGHYINPSRRDLCRRCVSLQDGCPQRGGGLQLDHQPHAAVHRPPRPGSGDRAGHHELSRSDQRRIPEHPRSQRAHPNADDRVRSDLHAICSTSAAWTRTSATPCTPIRRRWFG